MSRSFTRIFLAVVLGCAPLTLCGSPAPGAQLLVTNFFNNSVDLYDLTSTSATLAPGGAGFIASGSAGLSEPSKVVVGPDGNIYVSSRGAGSHSILVYDRTGQPLASAPGGPGVYAVLDENAAPAGLTFRNGLLYVADQGGDSVEVFDGNSINSIASIRRATPAQSAMVQPSFVHFDSNGNLLISTFRGGGPAEIFVWDGSSVELLVDETTATNVGLFAAAGIVTGPDGRIYVASLGGNGVVAFASNGVPTSPFNIQIPFVVPPTASFFPTNAPADVIMDGNDLLIAVLGPTRPGEAAGYPLGGLLRYTAGGDLITLAYEIDSASSFALFETVPEPAALGLGLVGLGLLGCWCLKRRRKPAI